MDAKPTAALFDLDGTLVDHFNVIYRCYCHALRTLGLPPVSFEKVKASVGGSIVVTFGKLIPADRVDEAVVLFREHFRAIWDEEVILLAGADRLVRRLAEKGMPCGVLTNKEGFASRQIIELVGLAPDLRFTLGTLDTPYRKPDPAFTRIALERLESEPTEACLIGDSPYDVATATAVGMRAYVVATGSHSEAELRETGATAVFADLPALARGIFGLELGPCVATTFGRGRAEPLQASGTDDC